MYTTSTISVMTCDNCGKHGNPHPEADGSLGLVSGWCHYDPAFMTSPGIRLNRRVDFCSVNCRDLWLNRVLSLFRLDITKKTVIYQFSERDRK